jgi:hypothetical protein
VGRGQQEETRRTCTASRLPCEDQNMTSVMSGERRDASRSFELSFIFCTTQVNVTPTAWPPSFTTFTIVHCRVGWKLARELASLSCLNLGEVMRWLAPLLGCSGAGGYHDCPCPACGRACAT